MHAPEQYEEFKSSARKDIEEAVPLLLSKISPLSSGSLILDYGCGAGSTGNKFFVPLAEETDSKLDAIDISSEMIEFARKTFPHPRVNFHVGNILDAQFPLKGNKYERVFAIYVFHYIQDYKSAMRRFHQLLKPRGEFGFSVLARSFLFNTYRIVGENPLFKEYMQGYEEFIPKWYQEAETVEHAKECFDHLLTNLGFEVVHSQIHYQKRTVVVDVLVELYIALNPFVKKIPAELMGDLRKLYREVTTKYRGVAADAETYEASYEMLTYVVRKGEGDFFLREEN